LTQEDYMKIALTLAKKGAGFVSPNPMVGAVIVKDGKIIGQGYHQEYGKEHAERNALKACTESPKGADMYVTLEPCCHQGKQPPCVEAILEAGIERVIIASTDPNPMVAGKGIQMLREKGVYVTTGIMKKECDALNEAFFHYIKTGQPFVTMKYAMTMDGKIAAYTGLSKWITDEISREHVHRERAKNHAIMVGVGTVLSDDPMLNCRIEGGHNPVRIVCDTGLRTPLNSKIVETAIEMPTMIATCCEEKAKWQPYLEKGCQLVSVRQTEGHVDLQELMKKLGKQKISSILLEGGGTLNWAALNYGIVQKVQAYIAPKLFGGEAAKTPIEGIGVSKPEDGVLLGNSKIISLGNDFLIESEVCGTVYRNH